MKLFSKRKNKNSEIENQEVQGRKEPELRTTIIHSQRICNGLLYSTEDSELVVCWKHSDSCEEDKAALFKTKNGRWFRCLQKTKKYVYFDLDICKYIVYEKTISYSNIIPINEDYAKRTVGDYDVQKYMELWGDEVEEA